MLNRVRKYSGSALFKIVSFRMVFFLVHLYFLKHNLTILLKPFSTLSFSPGTVWTVLCFFGHFILNLKCILICYSIDANWLMSKRANMVGYSFQVGASLYSLL